MAQASTKWEASSRRTTTAGQPDYPEWMVEVSSVSSPDFAPKKATITSTTADIREVMGSDWKTSGIHATYHCRAGRCDFGRIRRLLGYGEYSKLPTECHESVRTLLDILGEHAIDNPLADSNTSGFVIMEEGVPKCVLERAWSFLEPTSKIQKLVVTRDA